MSSSIYSVSIEPQSSCQSDSEEGVGRVRVPACRQGRRRPGGEHRVALQPRRAMPMWRGLAANSPEPFNACTLRELLSRVLAGPEAFLWHFSKHGMQPVQCAEAGGAVQITLWSLSGNALRFILLTGAGCHLAECNLQCSDQGIVCVLCSEWASLSDLSVAFLLYLLGLVYL
jgi:hypothetical protein